MSRFFGEGIVVLAFRFDFSLFLCGLVVILAIFVGNEVGADIGVFCDGFAYHGRGDPVVYRVDVLFGFLVWSFFGYDDGDVEGWD